MIKINFRRRAPVLLLRSNTLLKAHLLPGGDLQLSLRDTLQERSMSLKDALQLGHDGFRYSPNIMWEPGMIGLEDIFGEPKGPFEAIIAGASSEAVMPSSRIWVWPETSKNLWDEVLKNNKPILKPMTSQ